MTHFLFYSDKITQCENTKKPSSNRVRCTVKYKPSLQQIFPAFYAQRG